MVREAYQPIFTSMKFQQIPVLANPLCPRHTSNHLSQMIWEPCGILRSSEPTEKDSTTFYTVLIKCMSLWLLKNWQAPSPPSNTLLNKTSGGPWAPEPCWLWEGLQWSVVLCFLATASAHLSSQTPGELMDLSSGRSVLLRAKWLSRYLGQREGIYHVLECNTYKLVQTIPKAHNNYMLLDMCAHSMKK